MRRVAIIGSGVAALAVSGTGAEAAALCGGPPPVVSVDFAPGNAALPRAARADLVRRIREAVGGSELVAYRVVPFGDAGAGPALTAARGEALRRWLRGLPRGLRARTVRIETGVGRSLPAFSARMADGAEAVIEIAIRYRDANGVYIAC